MKNLTQEADKSTNAAKWHGKNAQWKYFSKIEKDIFNSLSIVDPMADISNGTLKDDTGQFF